MEDQVHFLSDGLNLYGVVQAPSNLNPNERRPAFLVLHGFGGNKEGSGQVAIANQLIQWAM